MCRKNIFVISTFKTTDKGLGVYIAEVESKIAQQKQAEEEKRIAEEKAAEEKKIADAQAAQLAAEQKAQIEAQKNYEAMIRDITTGWNTETTNMDENNYNWNKAANLVKAYPNYIHESPDNWIDVNLAFKKPWEFYGQVVNLSGRIYSIEQLPPGNSVAKFFNGECYDAMLAANEDYDLVPVSLYIVGNSDGIYENSQVSVKGYIYGHANLVNGFGGSVKGLSFIGFRE